MRYDRWGVTDAEAGTAFPCDALGFVHDESFLRGTDVGAPAAIVFRWLCQLRVAPYSYDWLDNFGRRSPRRLVPGVERLARNQRIMHLFRLVDFEDGASMTIALASRAGAALMGDIAGSYVVSPSAGGARLLAKVLVRYPGGPYGSLLRRMLPRIDSWMFAEQLSTLRRLAEESARESGWTVRPFTD